MFDGALVPDNGTRNIPCFPHYATDAGAVWERNVKILPYLLARMWMGCLHKGGWLANLKEIFVSILADQLDTYTSQQKVREVGFGDKISVWTQNGLSVRRCSPTAGESETMNGGYYRSFWAHLEISDFFLWVMDVDARKRFTGIPHSGPKKTPSHWYPNPLDMR